MNAIESTPKKEKEGSTLKTTNSKLKGPSLKCPKGLKTKEAKRKAENEVQEQDPTTKTVPKGRADSNSPAQGLLGLLSSTGRKGSAKENARC